MRWICEGLDSLFNIHIDVSTNLLWQHARRPRWNVILFSTFFFKVHLAHEADAPRLNCWTSVIHVAHRVEHVGCIVTVKHSFHSLQS